MYLLQAKANLNLETTSFKMTFKFQLSLIGEQYFISFNGYLLQGKANLNLETTSFKMTFKFQLSLTGEQYFLSFSVYLLSSSNFHL